MVDTRGLVGARPTGEGQILRILSGYVSLNRTAPTDHDDPVWVIIPSHSPDTPYGPFQFAAEHGATLPAAGTSVVVGIDDLGQGHILRWYGAFS
jgi:hypothetical protein